MILFFDYFFETEEDLQLFLDMVEENLDEYGRLGFSAYSEYVLSVFRKSLKLQEDVEKQISSDLVSYVILPYETYDDYNELNFSIFPEEERDIRKREEILFQSLCDKHFKKMTGLFSYIELALM